MKSEEIMKQFEDDLVAGKNPTPAEYEAKYGPIDPETKSLMEVMLGLVLLGEEVKLPNGFEERQRKVARDLIARKKAEEMVSHWQKGEAAFKKGELDSAREHYERLLVFVKYLKDEPWVAFASSRLGYIADKAEDYDKALAYHLEALVIYQKLQMKLQTAVCLHNIANIYHLVKRDYAQGRKYYQSAIEVNEELGATFPLAHEYLNLGTIERYLGHNELAGKYYQTSLELFQKRADTNGVAMAEYNLAELSDSQFQPDETVQLYESALEHFQETGNWPLVAQTAGALAAVYLNQGKTTRAKQLFQMGLAVLKKIEGAPRRKPYIEVPPEIPEETKSDPARLLRFLLEKEAQELQYQ